MAFPAAADLNEMDIARMEAVSDFSGGGIEYAGLRTNRFVPNVRPLVFSSERCGAL
jgi:hypothetical protein